MYIVQHAGVHVTDEDRLIKCLLRNSENFCGRGVAVPRPSRYRRLIRDTLNAMTVGELSKDARAVMLDAILDGDMPDRLILSNDNFFGVPKLAVRKGVFYPGAEKNLARLCCLFPGDQIELWLALRNPATFLPAVFAVIPDIELSSFMEGSEPHDLRWSELLIRISTAVPDVAITVWCNEDTPLIWARLIREICRLEADAGITGEFDLLADIMSESGMQRLRAYLKLHPTLCEVQKRRVIAAFLDKYALDEAIEEEIDLPGWTQDTIRHLTEIYEDDLIKVQQIPSVNLIAP